MCKVIEDFKISLVEGKRQKINAYKINKASC